jgi:uncharacterized membrane protein
MDKWLYRISTILVVVGLLVSIYMTIYKVTSNDALCLGSGDCSTVNASRYSEVYGIPVAVVGISGYFAILLVHWHEHRLFSQKLEVSPNMDSLHEKDESLEMQETLSEPKNNSEEIEDPEIEESFLSKFFEKNSTMLIFGLALAGFLFTVYLMYVEFAILQAFCPFCLTSQAAMTIIFIISIVRLVRQPQ